MNIQQERNTFYDTFKKQFHLVLLDVCIAQPIRYGSSFAMVLFIMDASSFLMNNSFTHIV